MGIFKLRKNKKFSYTPRHFDDKGEGSPFQIKHKFDEYRKTVGSNAGLKTKINNALDDLRNNPDKTATKRIIIIICVLLLLFLFIIDFDLSIFFSKK
ncbi:riboflavin synthase subunit beta [Yeosuana sp.]|uniref:riboflavin synthase subunit beta n=1 Tax=Yeosuana sp. TaxID=2529388 RepID=UPI0040550F5B|tara:strand:- start:12025 stop:12315 length:291 start_codon:yes stop_codon:yes gene_type:complete